MNPVEQVGEEILVVDAQNGDRDAFDTLVSRWQKRLWRHALNLTGLTGAAWEISQESWLDIVRGLARLHDPAKFGNWAYRIVSNKSHDWRRRRGRDHLAGAQPEGVRASIDELGAHERVTDVREVLHQVSPQAQAVLNLYYLEGFSLAEIAGILGTPEGTVKSRLHAARIEFRNHWEALGGKVTR